jgi:hypothetical protein
MSSGDVKALSLTELKKQLQARGVEVKGMLKGEMQVKLQELMDAEAGKAAPAPEPAKEAEAPQEAAPAPVEIAKPAPVEAPAAAEPAAASEPADTTTTSQIVAEGDASDAPVTKLDRAKRFGLPVKGADNPVSVDRLKNRAARFGMSVAEPINTEEKKNKRAAKFGLNADDKATVVRASLILFPTSCGQYGHDTCFSKLLNDKIIALNCWKPICSTQNWTSLLTGIFSQLADDKLKSRANRFGIPVKTQVAGNANGGEDNEKKRKRAERYAALAGKECLVIYITY